MASSALFIGAPRSSGIVVTTANTAVDGTGTIATVFTAGASAGSRLKRVIVQGRVAAGSTQAADTVNIFSHDGTTYTLLRAVLIPVGSGAIAAGVPNYHTSIEVDWELPIGYSLRASTYTGGATATYVVTAMGGDY